MYGMQRGDRPAFVTYIPVILTLFLVMFQGALRTESNCIDVIRGEKVSTRGNGTEGDMIIHNDLVIEEDETLEIEAGTIISIAPDVNITVKGSLIVKGEANDRVIFRPLSSDFAWGGLLIDATGSVHICNADLSGAKRAIICNNSSPILENLTIRDATSGMIFLGGSTPLVRNVTFMDVTNSIGMQGEDEGRTGMVFGTVPWKVELAGGDRVGEHSAYDLSSEMLGALLEGFIQSEIDSLDKIILRKEITLTRDEIESRIRWGDLRLTLFSQEMEIDISHVNVRVNGVLQNNSGIGKWAEKPPDHLTGKGSIIDNAVYGTGFFQEYSENLEGKKQYAEAGLPLLTNFLPTECNMVLSNAFHEGINEIEVEMDGDSVERGPPSIFLGYATPSRGIFDNITITDGGDWGVYLSRSSPVLSRLTVADVPRHMILKQDSHPFIMDSSFRGNGAKSGILSSEKGSSIRVLASSFSDFHCPPVEMSQGLMTLHSCRFTNIDDPENGALLLEPNPFILPDISRSLDLIPIHIENITMENVSGCGLHMDGGRIRVSDSSFRYCENAIYVGEGTRGTITGNDLSDIYGTGLLVYRAVNDDFTIASNRLVNIEKSGIVIKETRVRISGNFIEGCSDISEDTETLTRTDMLSKNWALFMERGGGYVEGNSFSNNTYSILVGIDSTVTFKNNSIVGRKGIGVGILSEKAVRLSDTIVHIDEKYDIVRTVDSDVHFENSQFNTTWYLKDDELSDGGARGLWIPCIIAFFVIILLMMMLWRKRNRRKQI